MVMHASVPLRRLVTRPTRKHTNAVPRPVPAMATS